MYSKENPGRTARSDDTLYHRLSIPGEHLETTGLLRRDRGGPQACAAVELTRPTTGRVARPTSTIVIVTDPLKSRQRLFSGTTLDLAVLVPLAGLTRLRTAGETFHLCPVSVITVTVFLL